MKINVGNLVAIMIGCLLLGALISGAIAYDYAYDKAYDLSAKENYDKGYIDGKDSVICEKCEICEICETCPEPEIIKEREYLGEAVSDFVDYIEDEGEAKGYWECGNWEYDFDQISVRRVDKDWNIYFEDLDYRINFSVRLKYLDRDFNEKCYENFNDIEIFYEDGEDPVIENY